MLSLWKLIIILSIMIAKIIPGCGDSLQWKCCFGLLSPTDDRYFFLAFLYLTKFWTAFVLDRSTGWSIGLVFISMLACFSSPAATRGLQSTGFSLKFYSLRLMLNLCACISIAYQLRPKHLTTAR